MNRRDFLVTLTVAGGVATTTGCLETRGSGTGIVSKTVEHVEPRRIREQKSTIVEFDDDAHAVRVLGYMYYGSSSCNKVGLEAAQYDGDTDELRVVVTPKSTNHIPFLPVACTADMAATWYRVTVIFADELPETITVVEHRGDKEEQRTVNRTDQHELCTTDHPQNSSAGQTAHWTCPERYIAVSRSTNTTDTE
ncbi:twin-arginine translocation signal domain-containing protein [Halomicrococcus sp. NG-SE-24]|uniref:twin-arginine translocation signal domain-containing protein n=1 Tax=Halomicrococcus sp. NG-SE-24 TaxID=3436928 RepID=UPI003D98FB24